MRQLAGLAVIVFAIFGMQSDGGGGTNVNPSGTSAIAEQAARTRSAILAAVYDKAADMVESGEIGKADALADAIVKGAEKAEAESPEKLNEDAAKHLPEADIDDPKQIAAWLRAVSDGFKEAADG